MHSKILLTVMLLSAWCFGATTSVRIYQQVGNASSYQNRQIGIDTVPDAVLGWRMWSGKDAIGAQTKFLAKDKHARVDSLISTGGASLNRVYIDSIRTLNYLTTGTADSIRARSINVGNLYYGIMSGGSKISADTIQAVKLINLQSNSGEPTGGGNMWFDSTEGVFHLTTCFGLIGGINRTIFVQSSTPLCSNTVTQTSLMGYDSTHALDSLPTNFFKKGKNLIFAIAGLYSTKATGPGTATLRMKLNNTVLCSAIVALDANELNQPWNIDGSVTCIDTGATGMVRFISGFEHSIAGIMHQDPLLTLGTTLNTTIKQRPDFTVQFSLADARNKIKSYKFYIIETH